MSELARWKQRRSAQAEEGALGGAGSGGGSSSEWLKPRERVLLGVDRGQGAEEGGPAGQGLRSSPGSFWGGLGEFQDFVVERA